MKKSYIKPELAVEDFLVSEYIASCHPSFANNMDVDKIIADVQGFTGYFTSKYNCANLAQEGFDYMTQNGAKLCYHTYSAVIFSS